MFDLFLVYQFIRKLATPFKEWKAFELGIIDEDGNILRKRRDLNTREEKSAFGVYDVMLLKPKRLLEKTPGGKSRLASYAAALYLIKEWNHFTDNSMLTESVTDEQIQESINYFFSDKSIITQFSENVNQNKSLDELFTEKFIDEDAPTVSAGSGVIAGIGVGPDGEPGVTKKKQKKYKKKNLRDIISKIN